MTYVVRKITFSKTRFKSFALCQMSMEWWIFTWSVAAVEHIHSSYYMTHYQNMQLPISLVTEVEESVVTSVIFSLLSKYFSPRLKASRSMFGDFRCTSRLSIVSTWSITLLEISISEYVQYFAHLPGESQRPSPDSITLLPWSPWMMWP